MDWLCNIDGTKYALAILTWLGFKHRNTKYGYNRINNKQVIREEEINNLCESWFKNRKEPTLTDHKQMNAILDQSIERFKMLGDRAKELIAEWRIAIAPEVKLSLP